MELKWYWDPCWSQCWFVQDEDGDWYVISHTAGGWEDRLLLAEEPSTDHPCGPMPHGMLEWLGIGLEMGEGK